MQVTFDQIQYSPEIRTYITQADASLIALGFTEHSFAHVSKCAQLASSLLLDLGYSEREAELARIAAREHLPHDITELVLKAYGDKYQVTVQQMAVRPDGSPVVVPDMTFPGNTIHGIAQHI